MPTQIEGFRLSPQQRRTWSLQEDGAAPRAQCALLLEGGLDAARLKEAVALVVKRHEALRTTFHIQPGLSFPIQVVAERAGFAWHVEDLSELEGPQQESAAAESFREESCEPFDFERGPALNCRLLSFSPARHILILSLPSLCADAWTLRNLAEELAEAYARPEAVDDEEESVPYAQFAEWQNELLEDPEGEEGRRFWREHTHAQTQTPSLPFESRPPAGTRFEHGVVCFEIDDELAARLERAAARHEVSTTDFLFACWQALLWRLSGAAEFVVGLSTPCRKYEELRDAFGPLAKVVPVVARLDGETRLAELLARVRDSAREAQAWQDYFTWEDGGAQVSGAEARHGFPFCFEFDEWPEARDADGLTFSLHARHVCAETCKAGLACVRAGGAFRFELHYDLSLQREQHAEAFARSFAALLESAVENPAAVIEDLEIVGAEDLRQLLFAFNQTDEPDADERCLQEMFERRASLTPDAAAVVAAGERLTYAALDSRSNKLARRLRRTGVRPDSRVAICLERSADLIVAILAVLKSGGAYMPIDPEQPSARALKQIEKSAASALLTQRSLSGRFTDYEGQTFILDDAQAEWLREPSSGLVNVAGPHNLAYVIYTSGSTGEPKGVGVTHRGASSYTRAVTRRIEAALGSAVAGLNIATVSTVAADLGNTSLFASLAGGGCLHVMGKDEATGAEEFDAYVRTEGVEALKIVPSHLGALIGAGGLSILEGMRAVVFGGEALSWELAREAAGSDGGRRVINHYGPTETTVGALACAVDVKGAVAASAATVPIGRPLANSRAYVLDARMRPAPCGVAGELYIGGEGVARGYLGRPELTAERFVPDPFAAHEGERLYRTGDVVRWLSCGEVEFLGRVDHQVKVKGFRVEPGEIEATLRTHESVRDAVVVAREDAAGGKRLVAYVVAGAVGAEELRRFLKGRLPEYMVPSAFVLLDVLPLTPNGKVDRRALPEPEQARAEPAGAYVAPRTELEEALCAVWSEVLGVGRVGVNNNFFELGGDSILSLQVIARARRLGLRLSPKLLFERPTVAALAASAGTARVSVHVPDGSSSKGQESVSGEVPLAPIQRWFFDRELPEPSHWNMGALFEVPSEADPALLREALRGVVDHHDALRLRFVRDESARVGSPRARPSDAWRQFNAPAGVEVPFERFDFSRLGTDEQRAALERAAAELQKGLDLERGPLVRAAHFELGTRGARLLVVVHHLVVDAVSWRILVEDLTRGYEQLRRGEAVTLGAKTDSYQSWAASLVECARGEALNAEEAYWVEEETRGRGARLPLDNADGENNAGSARGVNVRLGAEETERLLRGAPRGGAARVQEVLLAALGMVLCEWAGVRGLTVDVEGHGRDGLAEDVDVSRTVGWFTCVYPVWLECGEGVNAARGLAAVRERLRGVAHGGVGYGVLRHLREGLLRGGASEVSFNYLGQFGGAHRSNGNGANGANGNGAGALLRASAEPIGDNSNPAGRRAHVLKVNALVSGGELQVNFGYSENLHRRETVERIAGSYVEAVRSLIEHCEAPESAAFTTADFPHAKVSQEALNDLLSRLGRDDRRRSR